MPHYRENNKEGQFPPKQEKSKSKFIVSNKSFRSATLVSSICFSVFFVILFVSKRTFSITESDIQTICQITAGISGLALAIPLFLRDFEVTSNFWRQFYLIAITFLFTTFIGVFSFLEMSTEEIGITIFLWFFFSIIISITISNIDFTGKRTRRSQRIDLKANSLLNFYFSILVLIISLLFAKGNILLYSTILFTIYGFFLTLSLMLSVLIELHSSNSIKANNVSEDEDNDFLIKKAIENLSYNHRSQALTEQQIIDMLRVDIFSKKPQIVSPPKVFQLITEMTFDTDENNPLLSSYERIIIPRWREEFTNILKESNPKIFFLNYNSDVYNNSILKGLLQEPSFLKKYGDKIYSELTANTNLSIELLKDYNALSEKYKIVKFINGHSFKSNTYNGNNYLMLVDKEYEEIFEYIQRQYYSDAGDFFNVKEFSFLKTKLDEVYFDYDISIELIEELVRNN